MQFLLIAGALRLGQFTNFISHPVIAGFTTAAALIIGFSQAKHLLGIDLTRTSFIPSLIAQIYGSLTDINIFTVMIGFAAIALLLAKDILRAVLVRVGVPTSAADLLSKGLPLVVVVAATLFTFTARLDLTYGISTVGTIPSGLPLLVCNPVTRYDPIATTSIPLQVFDPTEQN